MTAHHELMGGKLHVYKRENSDNWQCSTFLGGKNHRVSTKQDSLAHANDFAEDWYLELRGKFRRGEIKSGKTFDQAADQFNYMLKRWDAFARFLDDGRICITNNAAERALRSVAIGRKSWLFAGSERGGDRAAVVYSLIYSARLNDVDPLVWLTDVLARIAEHPLQRLDELLPWNWRPIDAAVSQAA